MTTTFTTAAAALRHARKLQARRPSPRPAPRRGITSTRAFARAAWRASYAPGTFARRGRYTPARSRMGITMPATKSDWSNFRGN